MAGPLGNAARTTDLAAGVRPFYALMMFRIRQPRAHVGTS